MLCPVFVRKNVTVKKRQYDQISRHGFTAPRYTGDIKVKEEKTVICGKKSEVILKASYKELFAHCEGEGKHEDLFYVCAHHGQSFLSPKQWNDKVDRWRGGVSGSRGIVDSVEVIQSSAVESEILAKEDKIMRIIASTKQDFKRRMRQSNKRYLTPEHWEQAFKEALEEWIVESVQNS